MRYYLLNIHLTLSRDVLELVTNYHSYFPFHNSGLRDVARIRRGKLIGVYNVSVIKNWVTN